MKKILVVISIICVFLMAGCSKENGVNPSITGGDFVESSDFPKLMMNPNYKPEMAETKEGFYYIGDGLYLRYYDKKTGKTTVVCNKPNCKHDNGETCGGAINAFEIHYYNDKLYFEKSINGGRYVYSIDPDGNNLKKVQLLENNYNYNFADNASFIIHRGIVYYPISTGEIMANKLGADEKNAIAIFKENKEELQFQGGMQVAQDNIAKRMLYADGDYIYLRIMKKEKNKYVETFYRYNALTGESKQVFQIPSEEIVGSWDETGVKSQGWYINGDEIYYFLSGNGLWKYNTDSKNNSKVIDLKGISGFGTLDGKYLYINNGSNIDGSKITLNQSKNLSIKVYEIETGNNVGEINYKDIYKNGKYVDFKIAGLTSSGILLMSYNEYSGIKTYYYADRIDIKNSKFQMLDFGLNIQDEESKIGY